MGRLEGERRGAHVTAIAIDVVEPADRRSKHHTKDYNRDLEERRATTSPEVSNGIDQEPEEHGDHDEFEVQPARVPRTAQRFELASDLSERKAYAKPLHQRRTRRHV